MTETNLPSIRELLDHNPELTAESAAAIEAMYRAAYERLGCTCVPGQGCDEEGEPGCAYCRSLDPELPCPADVERVQ